MDDAERLAELFHAAEITIVAVAVHTDRNIKIDFIVCVVWLRLSDIPWYTGSSKHDT
jgi:hypothetical protein